MKRIALPFLALCVFLAGCATTGVGRAPSVEARLAERPWTACMDARYLDLRGQDPEALSQREFETLMRLEAACVAAGADERSSAAAERIASATELIATLLALQFAILVGLVIYSVASSE